MYVHVLLISLLVAGNHEKKELGQALKEKAITVKLEANPKGSHYTHPLLLTITGVSGNWAIEVKPGTMFIPDNDTLQNMMVTATLLAQVKAGESVTIPVEGMCTEPSDRAPYGGEKYTYGGPAPAKLTQLAAFADQNRYTGHVLQEAIWAMARNDLYYLSGFDTTTSRKLTEYLAKAMNKPMPPRWEEDDYERNYYAETPFRMEVSGEVEFDYPWPIDVVIGLYNENNILVRELHNEKQMSKGYHKLEYMFDASVYTADNYVIKTYLDNELAFENRFSNRRNR